MACTRCGRIPANVKTSAELLAISRNRRDEFQLASEAARHRVAFLPLSSFSLPPRALRLLALHAEDGKQKNSVVQSFNQSPNLTNEGQVSMHLNMNHAGEN